MAFCPYCGTKNPEEAIACVMCGELLPTSAKKGKRRTSSTATPADEPQRARSTPKRANETQYLDMGDEQSNDAEPMEGRLLGNVKLVVEQGMILGEQFLLNDQELLIGRFDATSGHCPDIDLSAQDPSFVHRRHARLEFSSNGERLTLFDLGGRNGAYVNNRPVEQNGAAPVRIGDKIRIGRVVMRLQPTEEAESYDRGR